MNNILRRESKKSKVLKFFGKIVMFFVNALIKLFIFLLIILVMIFVAPIVFDFVVGGL